MNTEEEWREVAGREGSYSVSSHGRVKCHDRFVTDASGKTKGRVRKRLGKILKPVTCTNRYLAMRWGEHWSRRTTVLIHRLVAEAFIPNPKNSPHVNHKDGDRTNNNVSNLEWVTAKENHYHARMVLGSKLGAMKLSATQAAEILSRSAEGKHALASEFGVKAETIYKILSRRSWKHV